jgi:uncharacterized protein YifN (PemK superfamily)
MPLQHQPKRRTVLFCDFRGFIAPEIIKRRPVVVVAVHKRNARLVTVVPLSTTPPNIVETHHYRLKRNPLPGAVAETWAKCDMIAVVSVERLDLVRTPRDASGRRRYLPLEVDQEEFDAIRRGVVSALGLGSLLLVPPVP